MTSEKQLVANQKNALKSTGPRTPSGKNRSALNSLKHCILSREVLLPFEDKKVFKAFSNAVMDFIDPLGELEFLLTDKVVACAWRLHRAYRVEAGVFIERIHIRRKRIAEQRKKTGLPRKNPLLELNDILSGYNEYEPDEDEIAAVEVTPVLYGDAFEIASRDNDIFTKLARYTGSIERELYRALHELRQLQESREARESQGDPLGL